MVSSSCLGGEGATIMRREILVDGGVGDYDDKFPLRGAGVQALMKKRKFMTPPPHENFSLSHCRVL